MDEMRQAYLIADAILDRHSADPDDDLAVLARQFIRLMENAAGLLTAQRANPLLSPDLRAIRDRLIKNISTAMDPDATGHYG